MTYAARPSSWEDDPAYWDDPDLEMEEEDEDEDEDDHA